MKLKRLFNDTRGSALIEYTITVSLFILMVFSIVDIGLLMWTQAGLQHGAELAARCASAAQAAPTGVTPSNCTTNTSIQTFAVNNSLGVRPPASTFTVTQNTTCGSNNGNLVTASYPVSLIGIYPIRSGGGVVTLKAQACYPN